MSKARQAADEVNRQQAGRRNLIINGAMQVWQRGTSFTGHSNGAYTADRYSVQKTGTSNVTRESCSLDEFEYCLKQTQTASGGGKHKPMQLVETGNYFANGTTLTFSFWARANATRAYGITAWDGTNVYGLGSVDITSSWQRFTKTFTLTSRPSSFLRLHVDDDVSQNDWIETTGWQLEVGDVATPFEHRSYGEELALCQRYFWAQVPKGEATGGAGSSGQYTLGSGGYLSNTQIEIVVHFPTTMRTAPSTSVSSGTNYFVAESPDTNDYFNSLTGWGQKKQSALLYTTSGTSGTAGEMARVAATNTNSYIYWDAEL